ncbi:MAG: hypothetical protein RL385_1147 [Pseudomonadota bacterium]|jgi:tetratricopeptide (TPR) repeat protein
MPSRAPHPIALRFDMLHLQWQEFVAEEGARLLRWQCTADEAPVVRAFVARESEPAACVTRDFFVRFAAPFSEPRAHGFALCQAFLKAYAEVRPSLTDEGLPADFSPPAFPRDDDVGAFVALLEGFFAHQAGGVDHLVAFFEPDSMRDVGAYQLWLQRLLHRAPPSVRIVVIDERDAPLLDALCAREPALICSVPAALDMQAALEQTARAADAGDAGGKFRQLFVALGGRAKAGDVEGAVPLAQQATALALSMGCPHLAAGIHMLLAGLYSAKGKAHEALQCYGEVDALGKHTIALGEAPALAEKAAPAAQELQGAQAVRYGLLLRRNARFGQGGVLIGERAYESGSKVYLESAKLSESLEDPRGVLDGLRLASFCYEQQGKVDEAFQCGMRGLKVGAAMDEDTRRSSTLPYLGASLLRMAERARFAHYQRPLATQFEHLLGADWQRALVHAPAPERAP